MLAMIAIIASLFTNHELGVARTRCPRVVAPCGTAPSRRGDQRNDGEEPHTRSVARTMRSLRPRSSSTRSRSLPDVPVAGEPVEPRVNISTSGTVDNVIDIVHPRCMSERRGWWAPVSAAHCHQEAPLPEQWKATRCGKHHRRHALPERSRRESDDHRDHRHQRQDHDRADGGPYSSTSPMRASARPPSTRSSCAAEGSSVAA